jgi:hypothetical protein
MLRRSVPTITGLFLIAGTAQARFSQHDADVVDEEERLEAASFHDANTYRFYPRFDRLWEDRDIGYRISDGSFDADRSRIHEQIKLSTDPEGVVRFAFTRDYYHDLVEYYPYEELRLAWKPVAGIYAAGLADGHSSYKQWGDLGAAVGWMRDRASFIEFYRWSVDHFYNSKAEVDLGVYHGKPATVGGRISWFEPGVFSLFAEHEADKRFSWERFDCDCTYTYQWQRTQYKIRGFVTRQVTAEANGSVVSKSEDKKWLPGGSRDYEKSLERRTHRHELSLLYSYEDLAYTQLGYVRIQRRSDYEFDFDNIPATFTFAEDPGADTSHREVIAFLFHSTPIDDAGQYFFQSGYSQNWVAINRDLDDADITGKSPDSEAEFRKRFADEAKIEQKFQFAFELHFRENLWLFLNATLDVDGIRKEFPYREAPTPGNIWDGGGVQFMAVF